jgi:hypothetical protein
MLHNLLLEGGFPLKHVLDYDNVLVSVYTEKIFACQMQNILGLSRNTDLGQKKYSISFSAVFLLLKIQIIWKMK